MLVIEDSNHQEAVVAENLAAYHEFVTPGSYFVVQDTRLGGPARATALGRISLQEAPMRRGRRRGDAGVSGVRLAVRCATPRPCSPLLSLTTTLASLHHKPDNSKSR